MFNQFASSAVFFLALLLWMAGAFGSLVFRNNDRVANIRSRHPKTRPWLTI